MLELLHLQPILHTCKVQFSGIKVLLSKRLCSCILKQLLYKKVAKLLEVAAVRNKLMAVLTELNKYH